MGKQDRIVYRRADGKQVNKLIDASRAGSVEGTQAAAEARARDMLRNAGGGGFAFPLVRFPLWGSLDSWGK